MENKETDKSAEMTEQTKQTKQPKQRKLKKPRKKMDRKIFLQNLKYTIGLLALAFAIMLGLIFVRNASHVYVISQDQNIVYGVTLLFPNGTQKEYLTKRIEVRHMGNMISFMNQSGQRVSYSGHYMVIMKTTDDFDPEIVIK